MPQRGNTTMSYKLRHKLGPPHSSQVSNRLYGFLTKPAPDHPLDYKALRRSKADRRLVMFEHGRRYKYRSPLWARCARRVRVRMPDVSRHHGRSIFCSIRSRSSLSRSMRVCRDCVLLDTKSHAEVVCRPWPGRFLIAKSTPATHRVCARQMLRREPPLSPRTPSFECSGQHLLTLHVLGKLSHDLTDDRTDREPL